MVMRQLGLIEEGLRLLPGSKRNFLLGIGRPHLFIGQDLAGIVATELFSVLAMVPANHGLMAVGNVVFQMPCVAILPEGEVGECKEVVVANAHFKALIIDHRPGAWLVFVSLCDIRVFQGDQQLLVNLPDVLRSPRLQILRVWAQMATRGPLAA